MRGNIDNLYALGSFTEKNKATVSYMGSSIDSTIKYINTYEKILTKNY